MRYEDIQKKVTGDILQVLSGNIKKKGELVSCLMLVLLLLILIILDKYLHFYHDIS